jgi:hypothetical protein
MDCLVDLKLTGGRCKTAFKDQEQEDIDREELENIYDYASILLLLA